MLSIVVIIEPPNRLGIVLSHRFGTISAAVMVSMHELSVFLGGNPQKYTGVY
jgi:hypothetical protein